MKCNKHNCFLRSLNLNLGVFLVPNLIFLIKHKIQNDDLYLNIMDLQIFYLFLFFYLYFSFASQTKCWPYFQIIILSYFCTLNVFFKVLDFFLVSYYFQGNFGFICFLLFLIWSSIVQLRTKQQHNDIFSKSFCAKVIFPLHGRFMCWNRAIAPQENYLNLLNQKQKNKKQKKNLKIQLVSNKI